MKSIAFFNNKGGVGKTTLLCNVAAYISLHMKKKVCVIDCDPQCNATQYLFDDYVVDSIYDSLDNFTIYSVIEPLALGEGYSEDIKIMRSPSFGVDVIVGDPRLALTEDLLAKDWGAARAGEVRGIRTNLVFSQLLSRLTGYDYVLFDVGPSLGAINRAVLLSADYFVSPMSIDIFSLRAFENISEWIRDWSNDWDVGMNNVKDKSKVPGLRTGQAKFVGYVTQQYFAKKNAQGERRAVKSFEDIRAQIDDVIEDNLLDGDFPERPYEIGTVQNLFSLVPMSQSNHKPVFELQAADGVVGAHFAKVKDSKKIFGDVAKKLVKRVQ